jgi:hypothetical protein
MIQNKEEVEYNLQINKYSKVISIAIVYKDLVNFFEEIAQSCRVYGEIRD